MYTDPLPSYPVDVALEKLEEATINEALLKARFTFAKTMPKHPHEYTLRENWKNQQLFDKVVRLIAPGLGKFPAKSRLKYMKTN